MRPRWLRALDAVSQLLNVLLFNGESNHSISGDAYRFRRERLRRLIDWLFSPFEPDHCRASHLADLERAKSLMVESPNP
ncbi:hypothetical protein N7320_02170 [Stutzerimonas stutzeri]|uniref:hypothetical protein n=1 Tax=Stutzerimonas stutzeri TaxID=316 RepID=UPI002446EB5A|nr:hypothetical protein [Stutzerimonas stutzeri]MDH0100120.1 hypothetical protein [Stutzerimonas stutzeri]